MAWLRRDHLNEFLHASAAVLELRNGFAEAHQNAAKDSDRDRIEKQFVDELRKRYELVDGILDDYLARG